jgi:potassium-transporting ATPase potassium-binding subunit
MHEGILLTLVYFGILFLLAWPLGVYISALASSDIAQRWPRYARLESQLLAPLGRANLNPMSWQRYALALIAINGLGIIVLYGLQRSQAHLPVNPAGMGAVEPWLAFNTAVSFVTNTNWQAYAGEATMSHAIQAFGLTVQNFLSAATGIAVAWALIRGFGSHRSTSLGNAWVDLWRATVCLLLPLSFGLALLLASQGVVQNWLGPVSVSLTDPVTYRVVKLDKDGKTVVDSDEKPLEETVTLQAQQLAMGPVASQVAIKMLGTNGGGFLNANSAHPFENPSPATNLAQMLAIFLVPAALVFAFGRMVADQRQGHAIMAAMTLLFVASASVIVVNENLDNPLITALGVDASQGNLEGKEVRFGATASAFFAALTTAASCGAVNAMHASFMPLGGGMALLLVQLGEVVFGGVGAGLYGMLLFCILAVFLAGLMIGRTPQYLGKKLGSGEMRLVAIAVLLPTALILIGTALAVSLPSARASILNPGAHGFTEVLYAFSSAANNNGSAFAGLNANTPFYNGLLAFVMWIGRFGVIIPVLALSGRLAAQPRLVATAGTMPTHGPVFVMLLVMTVLAVGALTYLPALALGPIAEHLALFARH